MTAFYIVFEFPPKSVLRYFGTSRARLEKRMIHSAQKIYGQLSRIFQHFQNYNMIFIFFRFQTQENRFWGLGTFLHVFFVHKFTDLFTVWTILYKFSPIFHKSFSYEPSRQYGTSPFLKTITK